MPLNARARAFAFEGMPAKDRFGIFDPALRGFYVFGWMLGAVVVVGGVFDVLGRAAAAGAVTAVALAFTGFAALIGYRRIWPTPVERELLLQMAKEDDESRAMRAKRARAARPPVEAAAVANSTRAASDVERSGDTGRKAF